MKDAEDEAFDELAKRQGAWGSGFQAKRQAAMDKINSEFRKEYVKYREAFPKGYTTQQVLPKDYTTQQRVPIVEIEYTLSIAEPAQEPVAIVHIKDGCVVGSHRDGSKLFPDGQYGLWPIATPPLPVQEPVDNDFFKVLARNNPSPDQRPWVGLTKVDVFVESKHWRNPEAFINGACWAEDTLKEKNCA